MQRPTFLYQDSREFKYFSLTTFSDAALIRFVSSVRHLFRTQYFQLDLNAEVEFDNDVRFLR
jgi:hypothetical protein